jgi:hypothetical protein
MLMTIVRRALCVGISSLPAALSVVDKVAGSQPAPPTRCPYPGISEPASRPKACASFGLRGIPVS